MELREYLLQSLKSNSNSARGTIPISTTDAKKVLKLYDLMDKVDRLLQMENPGEQTKVFYKNISKEYETIKK
jgi:hypothetical protein